MIFENFHKKFPKIAEKETRMVHVLKPGGLPMGDYGFVNSYCMDKTCDCRRTFLSVRQVHPDYKPYLAATISYGWEDFAFYRKWSRGLSDEILEEFKGPALDHMQRQSSDAPKFLDYFKNVLMKDLDYMERLKRHYAYVKFKQGMRLPPELKALIDLQEDCRCGSGRSFRRCCGRKPVKGRFSRRR